MIKALRELIAKWKEINRADKACPIWWTESLEQIIKDHGWHELAKENPPLLTGKTFLFSRPHGNIITGFCSGRDWYVGEEGLWVPAQDMKNDFTHWHIFEGPEVSNGLSG